ncbi:hypothetical protein B4U80_07549 [Leptotrombidium deliense]|uniref:Condensin complex subunit 2 n=1 Tax=Leptotrombidium deliense TaxID=299467 RepID=A0A443S4F9_9ACAR|nr:hypothetical protein B4U80_07549 [Leptotrombidium deliense]
MKGSKRVHKSDSSDSENVTPTKGSATRTHDSTTNKKSTKTKKTLNETLDNSLLNLTLREMNPVVVLDRFAIPQSLRKSLGQGNASPVVEARNDSEAREREERHRQRLAAQRRSHHSSAGTPDKRRTATNNAAQILNSEQLKDHYSVCIKLSATNKITTKNAFVLHLIDYMSDFLKNTNDGKMNFKLASSTLDAGAKIYCNRVDFVHAEAQKVASGLVMALDKKSTDKGQTQEAQDGEELDGVTDAEAGPKPKKKKVIKHSGRTLVQNVDTINISKIEANVEIDPLFHHISSGFDMGSVNCLLTANLRSNDNYQLMLDSGSRMNENTSSVRSSDVSLHMVSQHLFSAINAPDVKICPKVSDFVFRNRDDKSSFISNMDNDAESTLPDIRAASVANSKTSFVFDMNAEIEDDTEDGNFGGDLFGNDNSGDEFDEEMQRADNIAHQSLVRAVNLEGMMDLMKLLSDKPSEYSYFNKKFIMLWAGPEHWKPNRLLKLKRNAQNNAATSSKKTRVKKQDREVDFSKDLISKAEEAGSKNLQLKVNTMKKWTETVDNQLPDDHCYDPKMLTVPFSKPCSNFGSLRNSKEVPEVSGVHSNGNDFSAPGSPDIGDGVCCNDFEDDFPTEAYGETVSHNPNAPLSAVYNTGEQLPFAGDNLVAQPEAIEKIDLKYAKIAKKMDVKRLKRAMWDVLTATPCNTPNTESPSVEMTSHVSFNELYKNVPKMITKTMLENLSTPIAFVTLLHLANEKNLKLKANDEMTDFEIFQEAKFSL